MEYTIIHDSDFNAFINAVNRRLENGWKVQGGLAVVPSIPEGRTRPIDYFYQAMIKDEEESLGIFAHGVASPE